MEKNSHSDKVVVDTNRHAEIRDLMLRWAITIAAGVAVYLAPMPEGITPQSWRLLAIFTATIIGLIMRPVPGGAMVLI
ncbi:MAG: anion permease, partial [Acidobacteria bacterium]|nr:anion permease [Acidobacteriota bacterium]